MIVAIVGPTGVGKTKMSIELAKRFNAEIINADSTQIYKEINIGTAKVTTEEMEGVTHHLIDIKNLNEDYTVFDYQIDARKILDEILNSGKNAIIVGGSGLYLSALLYDYHFTSGDNIYDFDALTDEEMYNEVMKHNPEYKEHKNNRQRLVRAYAKIKNNSEVDMANIGGENLIYDCSFIGLTANRDKLYQIIDKRTEKMIEDGLINEARRLFNKYPNNKELETAIGYKELNKYFKGTNSLEEAIIKIKQNSRNYAKRQFTWFKNKMDIPWFDVDYENFDNTIKEAVEYLKGI